VKELERHLQNLKSRCFSPLDLLQPRHKNAEKLISLVLEGVPETPTDTITKLLEELRGRLIDVDTSKVNVVVFGGGTGLSNIIGGDSRRRNWAQDPFTGLKEIFPNTGSVVCITDDGGSTGELLKDVPLPALGDLRHVLLSSIRKQALLSRYGLTEADAFYITGQLHALFNYRFISRPESPQQLLIDCSVDLDEFPLDLKEYCAQLIRRLFMDRRLTRVFDRLNCLGNLLLASSIYAHLDEYLDPIDLVAGHHIVRTAIIKGLARLAYFIGANTRAVLPCTTTVSQLQVLYSNGVLVTSEDKSARARRGFPVDRVFVEFSREPYLPPEVEEQIRRADIILFAPGSLYTSIIPILQVPGLATAVRKNKSALKLLVANLWIQKGETDAARDNPDRKFYVSDMIRAYHRTIPGGVQDLFSQILCLKLTDIPGSVLQSYALEDKEPIFLDRNKVRIWGFDTVEAMIYSRNALRYQGVIQHDPTSLALAVRTLWLLKKNSLIRGNLRLTGLPDPPDFSPVIRNDGQIPCERYDCIRACLRFMRIRQIGKIGGREQDIREPDRRKLIERVIEIIWSHRDIALEHLEYMNGIFLVDPVSWKRCQEWDNVLSFYDPDDGFIKIRQDLILDPNRFEVAFLVALGQSLLGNYVAEKQMEQVTAGEEVVGSLFRLTMRPEPDRRCYFSEDELNCYLELARMKRSAADPLHYTRLINAQEGFTPPGLLFGLFYAWYLDNSFVAHIEYKMSILRMVVSDLIPEEIRITNRRKEMVRFFREKVFNHRVLEEDTVAPAPALPRAVLRCSGEKDM